MVNPEFIVSHIEHELPFTPNEGQRALLHQLCEFLLSKQKDKLFLLRGYAGTGKTSIVAALVKTLTKLNQKTVLLAPTGRAAKVLSSYAHAPAYTIHKKIYRQKQLGEDIFSLSQNLSQDTLFICDEASMIANLSIESSHFGTGRLLDDLIQFVYNGLGCSLLILGDNAQLPPVGQIKSPALQKNVLEGYGLYIYEHTLTMVARQVLESGILKNATTLREQINTQETLSKPEFTLEGYPDIQKIDGNIMLECLEDAYASVGEEETMIITRTNRRANLYNQGIRARILFREEALSSGDRLMVTKNNYFWAQEYEGIDFIANGDIFQVKHLRHFREMYGYHFVDATLKSVDYTFDFDTVLWIDTLTTESPEANYAMQRELFNRIAADYPDIRNRKDLVKTIMGTPYYNALQIRFAYAVTCHKAQGGQWARVFIDNGIISEEQVNTDYYRWLYTAVTRATEKLYLINF